MLTHMVTTRLAIDSGGMMLNATRKTDEPNAALFHKNGHYVVVMLFKHIIFKKNDHFLTIIVCIVLSHAVVLRGVMGTKHSLMPSKQDNKKYPNDIVACYFVVAVLSQVPQFSSDIQNKCLNVLLASSVVFFF